MKARIKIGKFDKYVEKCKDCPFFHEFTGYTYHFCACGMYAQEVNPIYREVHCSGEYIPHWCPFIVEGADWVQETLKNPFEHFHKKKRWYEEQIKKIGKEKNESTWEYVKDSLRRDVWEIYQVRYSRGVLEEGEDPAKFLRQVLREIKKLEREVGERWYTIKRDIKFRYDVFTEKYKGLIQRMWNSVYRKIWEEQ